MLYEGAEVGRKLTRSRKSDYGTVLLHWILFASFVVALLTGLRIASETPDRTWINALDSVLPASWAWTGHMKAAVILVAVSLAYPAYIASAGLNRRVRFDCARLVSLFGNRAQRWGAINVALYWLFYVAFLVQIVTGCLMYMGNAGASAVRVHWLGMWFMLGYVLLHILAHMKIGGVAQLLRILRPARLVAPPPFPPDLLAPNGEHLNWDTPPVIAEIPARPHLVRSLDPEDNPHQPARRRTSSLEPIAHECASPDANSARSARQHHPSLQANPLAVGAAAALAGVAFLLAVDHNASDRLVVHRIAPTQAPIIDGDASDPIWRKAPVTRALTTHGGNFDGSGTTTISIQALNDGVWAFFLFVWDDPTRSLKQLPLQKTPTGWTVLGEGHAIGDTHTSFEDKFSVLLTTLDVTLAGGRTFHAGPAPAEGKPRTLSGRGLHYTNQEGPVVDVWQWKATSTNASMYLDDGHFGPPATPTKEQREGKEPYRGGFAPDPGTASYYDNFSYRGTAHGRAPVLPLRLPKDLAETTAALGRVDLGPEHSDAEGARWYMTEQDSVPYSRERDAQLPVGTIIPGVIIAGEYSADRADVRCVARWAAGRWVLEVVRRLESVSIYDAPIVTGVFMRVAAFDHAEIRHTRHVRPIRLEVD